MFFLLRVAFWLSIVVMLLPGGAEQSKTAPQFSATDAMSAAGAAMSDLRQFCDRQKEACTVGSQAALAFGQKAQHGAKLLYEFLSEQFAPSETGSVPNAPAQATTATSGVGSQNTLTPTDLAPAWRGPRPDPRRPA